MANILSEISGVIYRLTCKTTGKSYKRWSRHSSSDSYLGCAIKKYTKKDFSIEILLYADNIILLNFAEEYYIQDYNTLYPNGYNLHTGGKNHIVSESTKQKMSLVKLGTVHSQETKNKMSESHKGHIVSEATKLKLSEARKSYKISKVTKDKMSNARKGYTYSDETKNKLSESGKKYWKLVREGLVKRDRKAQD